MVFNKRVENTTTTTTTPFLCVFHKQGRKHHTNEGKVSRKLGLETTWHHVVSFAWLLCLVSV